MTVIGFIGAAHIGTHAARAVTAAGCDVVLSSTRDAGSLAPLVAELGDHASAATVGDAAAAADAVVAANPDPRPQLGAGRALAQKTVIVTSNYNRDRQGAVAALDSGETTVPGLLQAHLPGAHVVGAFSRISSAEVTTAGRPAGTPRRRALAIARGDPGPRTPSPRSATLSAVSGPIWATAVSPRSSPTRTSPSSRSTPARAVRSHSGR